MARRPANAETFYMVCALPRGPHSVTAPRKRYATRADARRAAARLAADEGRDFVVLEAAWVAEPGDDIAEPGLF